MRLDFNQCPFSSILIEVLNTNTRCEVCDRTIKPAYLPVKKRGILYRWHSNLMKGVLPDALNIMKQRTSMSREIEQAVLAK
jgi:hypothetical protein